MEAMMPDPTPPTPLEEEAERIMLEWKDKLGILPLRWEALPPEIYRHMVDFLADALLRTQAAARRAVWEEAAKKVDEYMNSASDVAAEFRRRRTQEPT